MFYQTNVLDLTRIIEKELHNTNFNCISNFHEIKKCNVEHNELYIEDDFLPNFMTH